jgi:hypothetical protein
MTENKGIDLESKFTKITLIVVTVFLIFVGPTYIPYLLENVLNIGFIASLVIGTVLLGVGLIMALFLIRKRVIS